MLRTGRDISDVLLSDLVDLCGRFASFREACALMGAEIPKNPDKLLQRFDSWKLGPCTRRGSEVVVVKLLSGTQSECHKVSEAIRHGRFARVVIVGGCAVTSIAKGFLSECPDLTGVEFVCPWAKTVGCLWLKSCTGLKTVDFSGMGALTTVDDFWLFNCTSLETVHFRGLGALETVGHFWLSRCTLLTTVDFKGGLEALTTVGNCWLRDCKCLGYVDTAGLGSLETGCPATNIEPA
jgi:hypothetical protein